MKKENILLVLWIIFGYLFVRAVDAILFLVVNLVYFGLAELGMSFTTMSIVLPIFTFILYGVTTYLLIKRVNVKTDVSGIYMTEFPKKMATILGVIAFGLFGFTNKLRGMYGEHMLSDGDISSDGFVEFYGWFQFGFGISQLAVVITLLVVFVPLLKKLEATKED